MTALSVHASCCPRCRAGLGRPTGLLSHSRVRTAEDWRAEDARRRAEEAEGRALRGLRAELRERERVRRIVLLLAAHGLIAGGPVSPSTDGSRGRGPAID